VERTQAKEVRKNESKMYYISFGSNASLSALPIILKHKTMIIMASPGNIARSGLLVIK
jgi:hypothetical protein